MSQHRVAMRCVDKAKPPMVGVYVCSEVWERRAGVHGGRTGMLLNKYFSDIK